MTPAALRRIFTVSGATTETEERNIPWGYNNRLTTGFILATGEWWGQIGFNQLGATTMASDFADLTYIELSTAPVSADGTPQLDFPLPGAVLDFSDDVQHWVRMSTPGAGDSYVQWDATFVRVLSSNIQVRMENGTLVGADFPATATTYVQWMFERHTADIAVSTVTGRMVWGDLVERGSAVGIVDITTAAPTGTASVEEGTAILRYDPMIAVGNTLVDDLGREWSVRSSRTLEDRRYLEYDLTRTVAGASG